jgi:sec-independent protein translocase protein TatA
MLGWRELLIILVIVLVIFGAKKLTNIGKDLGGAVGNFKKGLKEGTEDAEKLSQDSEKAQDSYKAKDHDKGSNA